MASLLFLRSERLASINFSSWVASIATVLSELRSIVLANSGAVIFIGLSSSAVGD